MVEVTWTPLCLEDIENIAEYIAKDSVRYSEIQVADFFEAAIILETRPKAGRMVPEFGRPNVKELIIGFYRLIYRITDSTHIDCPSFK